MRTYESSIPINEVEEILRQANAYPRSKGEEPFPDLSHAIARFISTIELHNHSVETLHNGPTLTPRHQKDFYKKLQTRLIRLIELLQDGAHEYHERLYYHQVNTRPIEDRLAKKNGDDLFADKTIAEPIQPLKFINTLQAYLETAKHLEGNPINQRRKDIHRDDLKQLIHFLFEVYEECSGREPGYNYVQRNGKDYQYEGDFILLVELAIPFADLNNKNAITNNSIGEGLKSVKKERR